MLAFVVRRILAGIVLLLAMSIVTFSFLYIGAGDIARRILGENAPADIVERHAAELGLNRPLYIQYWNWLTSALTGDLGSSWFTGQQVSASISGRLPVTLSLAIGVIVVTVLASVLLGVLAARRGGWMDGTIQFLAVVGFAVPGYLVALALVLIFAINLGWFRATGFVHFANSPGGWAQSVTLPIIALSVGAVVSIAQQIRGGVVDAMSKDYVRTLRSRGLSPNRVVYSHMLRNAGGPALALLGVQSIQLLGGSVIIEQIFAIPGIGQLSIQATTVSDVPVVMGVVLVYGIIVVVVNFLIDLAQAALNPKVRLA